MAQIDFNRDSFNKCICGGCPVQRKSACVIEKEKWLAPQKDEIQSAGRMPDPGNMPGVYCSSPVGKSSCEDLSKDKSCLCPACPLHIMEGLEKKYYCALGSAEEIE